MDFCMSAACSTETCKSTYLVVGVAVCQALGPPTVVYAVIAVAVSQFGKTLIMSHSDYDRLPRYGRGVERGGGVPQ